MVEAKIGHKAIFKHINFFSLFFFFWGGGNMCMMWDHLPLRCNVEKIPIPLLPLGEEILEIVMGE